MLLEAPFYCWYRDSRPPESAKTNQHEAVRACPQTGKVRDKHTVYEAGDELPFLSLGEVRAGSYGRVNKVRLKTPKNTIYAKKRWWNNDTRYRTKHLEEIRLLFALEHLHIVRIVSSYRREGELGFLMTPFAETDLRIVLQSDDPPKSLLKKALGCLVVGLTFLHKENIIHGDIKPGNILLHVDRFLLTDFGCSKDIQSLERSATEATVLGTRESAAPELVEHLPRGRSADVFSLGCVLMEIFSVVGDCDSNDACLNSFAALKPYADHMSGICTWLQLRQKEHATPTESMWLDTCSLMLQSDLRSRPKATELRNMIANNWEQNQEDVFCAYCIRKGDSVCSSLADTDMKLGSTYSEKHLADEQLRLQVSNFLIYPDLYNLAPAFNRSHCANNHTL
jgi:serine/threonine protein kinase